MRILVLRLSSLGDIVLTQPVVQELRLLYPKAEIHFLCKAQYACLPAMFGADVKVVPYSKSLRWHLGLLHIKYDLVVDLHAKFSTALIRCLVKAKQKVVYNKQRKLRINIIKGERSARIESTVRLYYSALERLFPDKYTQRTEISIPRLVLPANPEREQLIPRMPHDKPVLGLFVGAAHATKAYPIQQWRDFIGLFGDDYHVCLLGDSSDSNAAHAIRDGFTDIDDFTGKLDLDKLIQFINSCDVIVSGDTGPMHLAAALGKKQIAIFGSTHPRLGFAPLNSNAIVLCANLECQPCSLHGLNACPLGHFNCMRQITPTMLREKLLELLSC